MGILLLQKVKACSVNLFPLQDQTVQSIEDRDWG